MSAAHPAGRTDLLASLAGKVAVITGAARGQGAAEAELLAELGAHVVLTDVIEDEGAALAGRLGESATFVPHDVSSRAAWDRVAEVARARH
ncbi:SDR family NAD(P)-dependent oxidoreductase, partial [Nocardioides massiliensis]